MWQLSLYQTPPFLAAIIAGLVVWGVWDRRDDPVAVPLLATMSGVFVWSFVYAIQLGFPSTGMQILLDRVAFVGAAVVPTAWFVFAARYAGRDQWLSRTTLALLAVEPAITVVLVWTNEFHGLIYRSVTVSASGPVPAFMPTFGPWYWVNIAYSYVLLLVALLLIVGVLAKQWYLYQRQAGALALGTVTPLATNTLFTFGLSPLPGVDLTTFTFAISGLLIAVSLFTFDLLDRGPLAHERLPELLGDGLIVVNEENRIVDFNPVAAEVFGEELELGRGIGSVLNTEDPAGIDGAELQADDGDRFYRLRSAPLRNQRDEKVGHVVALREVTDRKAYEQRLEVINRLYRST
ncbi:MAG: histidine kinase N-terminal 7TM domain-containing protein [Salinirussus sp.]